MLTDTHAHIHFDDYKEDLGIIFDNARNSKVDKIITVGTDDVSSRQALEFCYRNQPEGITLFATAGLHPHEASDSHEKLLTIKDLVLEGGYGDKLVAIGECGLDYYKNFSDKKSQFKSLEFQIELALDQHLPLVFHVRDAWEDFFDILNNYKGVRGVVHSFTGHAEQVEKALDFGLYFGINGIMTFTKDQAQLEACKLIPPDKLLFETDCPFLSPEPKRGRRNEPANIKYVAEFVARLRGTSLGEISKQTSTNAITLFTLK